MGDRLVMTTHRALRVADLVREILAGVVRDELRDPRIGFVTITDVRVSTDLKHARVFVSELGSETERSESVKALNRASSFLRRALGRRTDLRYVPELVFVEDLAAERGQRVESLLREIHDDDTSRDPSAPDSEDDLDAD